MAIPAGSKRKPAPAQLRIIQGRGIGRDGRPRDSGARVVEEPLPYRRQPPEKPQHLSADAEWLWDQVVEQMTTIGLLKPLDGAALEVACETFARWRDAVRHRREHGILGRNSQGVVAGPWTGVEERASREFRSWAAEFGFTPAAERALAVEGGMNAGGSGGDNPFG